MQSLEFESQVVMSRCLLSILSPSFPSSQHFSYQKNSQLYSYGNIFRAWWDNKVFFNESEYVPEQR